MNQAQTIYKTMIFTVFTLAPVSYILYHPECYSLDWSIGPLKNFPLWTIALPGLLGVLLKLSDRVLVHRLASLLGFAQLSFAKIFLNEISKKFDVSLELPRIFKLVRTWSEQELVDLAATMYTAANLPAKVEELSILAYLAKGSVICMRNTVNLDIVRRKNELAQLSQQALLSSDINLLYYLKLIVVGAAAISAGLVIYAIGAYMFPPVKDEVLRDTAELTIANQGVIKTLQPFLTGIETDIKNLAERVNKHEESFRGLAESRGQFVGAMTDMSRLSDVVTQTTSNVASLTVDNGVLSDRIMTVSTGVTALQHESAWTAVAVASSEANIKSLAARLIILETHGQ